MTAGTSVQPDQELFVERGWKVLATTSVGSVMVFVDTSILNVAFRSMVEDFGQENAASMTWVLSGYSIAFAAALLTAGRFGDRFGRKRTFQLGVLIFALASLGCALAPTVEVLIAFRIVQAIGGALVVPAALALVLPEFPPEKRAVAIGLSGAVGGLSAAFGPALGGLLVDSFGWRSVFIINLPLSVIALVLGQIVLRESRDETAVRLPDPLGGVLAMLGFGLVTAAIVEGESWGWGSTRTVGAALVGSAMIGVLVLRCRTHPIPVVDLGLFRYRFFTAANAASFSFSAGFFAMFFTNVSFLQVVWDYSPMRSGLASSPGPLLAAVFAPLAGSWSNRFGHKTVIVTGLAVFCAGVGLVSISVDTTPDYVGAFLPGSIITGIGVGLVIATLGSAANAYLPPHRFGMGSAVNATGRQLGAGLGIAAVSAIRLASDDLLGGFTGSWTFVIVTAALAAVVMLMFFVRPTEAEIDASRVVPVAAG
jgi:EmrB/QacA subfamily drug resistance transporter